MISLRNPSSLQYTVPSQRGGKGPPVSEFFLISKNKETLINLKVILLNKASRWWVAALQQGYSPQASLLTSIMANPNQKMTQKWRPKGSLRSSSPTPLITEHLM